jgi:hypothetical protein
MKLANSILTISLLTLGIAGCTTYQTTLTNAQGQTVTCKASGKAGLVTGLYLRQGFQQCVSNAEAHGYGSSPNPNSK